MGALNAVQSDYKSSSTLDTLWGTLYLSRNNLINLLQKLEPPWLMIPPGVQNMENIFFWRNTVTLFPFFKKSATTSTHFDTYSNAIRMYFIPFELTNGPLESIPKTSKSTIPCIRFIDSSCFFRIPPPRWQESQDLVKS